MNTATNSLMKTRMMTMTAVFAVLIAICSWISIPTAVPFTLQTFGIFLAVSVLGGKFGSLAVLVYILLGCVGVPVFAGFTGGIGVLTTNTGGYIVGFLAMALVVWALEKPAKNKIWLQLLSMVLGLAVCYAFGTVWFMIVYAGNSGSVGLMTVLGWCVIPFIIPDLIKMGLAFSVGRNLKKILRNLA